MAACNHFKRMLKSHLESVRISSHSQAHSAQERRPRHRLKANLRGAPCIVAAAFGSKLSSAFFLQSTLHAAIRGHHHRNILENHSSAKSYCHGHRRPDKVGRSLSLPTHAISADYKKINIRMNYFFTSESVSEGHPDKIADQISDALLDEFLARDPQSHVAIETLCTTGQVVVAGEVSSSAYVDIQDTVRKVIKRIGYTRGAYRFDGDAVGIFNAIHEQSPDIHRGVNRDKPENQGAGDQGMMFGYATGETPTYLPLTLDLSHALVKELAAIRREGKAMTYYRKGKEVSYLRPDAKSQVTVEYDQEGNPVRIDTIVVSTQHDEFVLPLEDTPEAKQAAEKQMCEQIKKDVREVLIPRVMAHYGPEVQNLLDMDHVKLHVNPTGKFVIGGPHGDTGLTGRKIIVDTYGGRGAHGGGAFSGKDPSKVDRSAAYALRHIAKNLVAAGVAKRVLVQAAYAIGEPEPVNIAVDTFGTALIPLSDAEIAATLSKTISLRPYDIEQRLQLRQPIYLETAAYGHMGRTPRKCTKKYRDLDHRSQYLERDVELFPWEKLDLVSTFRKAFHLPDSDN